jgi:hypothetical protein
MPRFAEASHALDPAKYFLTLHADPLADGISRLPGPGALAQVDLRSADAALTVRGSTGAECFGVSAARRSLECRTRHEPIQSGESNVRGRGWVAA